MACIIYIIKSAIYNDIMNYGITAKLITFSVSAIVVGTNSYSANCPHHLTMKQVSAIHETGELIYDHKLFKPASKDDLAAVLPGRLSPSWLTAQANLREEGISEQHVICRFAYKSAAGVIGSKLSKVAGSSDEENNQNFDYEFLLTHELALPPQSESLPLSSPQVAEKKVLLDVAALIKADPSVKEYLEILGLLNNPKIGVFVLTQQYKLKKDVHKRDPKALAKIENAYTYLIVILNPRKG
jgi:hypothetical protein